MKKIILIIILMVVVLIGFYLYWKNYKIKSLINIPINSQTITNQTSNTIDTSVNVTTTSTSFSSQTTGLLEPIADFKARITKKPFGIYITPQNSPVQPEKFTGYHTGADVEYGDVDSDVEVKAVFDGTIIYSGFVSGYGGFVAIQHDINGDKLISIYGHLNPDSLIANNYEVKKGDKIGVLGNAFSSQTDGERKHLHFAILCGENLDFRGYVQNESELSLWQNLLDYFN